jgi:ribosomal protein S18 acetylase RimI-like enzyme
LEREQKRAAPAVGDRVVLDDVSGTLVADLERHFFSEDYPARDWAFLQGGYLVLDDAGGLVHLSSFTGSAVPVGSRPYAAEGPGGADALMARLRESLTAHDGRSPTIPSEAAAQFRDAPGFLAAVIGLAADEERTVSEAATWILKSELEAGAKLDRTMTNRLIEQLGSLKAWQAKLHICQTVSHLDLQETAREGLRGWLTPLLDAERPFLRAWALDALCHLPGTRVDALLRRMAEDSSASVRARVRNLRRAQPKVKVVPVRNSDHAAIVALSVRPDQAGHVAPNEISLAEAAGETGAYPFCVTVADRIVGLLLAVDMAELDPPSALFGPEDAYLWRFMIAVDWQGRGHGRQAMAWFHHWAQARGKTRLVLTVREDNSAARAFYASVGYRPTGRVRNGEVEYARDT